MLATSWFVCLSPTSPPVCRGPPSLPTSLGRALSSLALSPRVFGRPPPLRCRCRRAARVYAGSHQVRRDHVSLCVCLCVCVLVGSLARLSVGVRVCMCVCEWVCLCLYVCVSCGCWRSAFAQAVPKYASCRLLAFPESVLEWPATPTDGCLVCVEASDPYATGHERVQVRVTDKISVWYGRPKLTQIT